MQIELGAAVRASDGQEIGTVDRLIVDPESGGVKAAVLRRGALLTRDVEVPLDALQVDADGAVTVLYSAAEVEALPEFEPDRYVSPPLEYVSPVGYPATGLAWPSSYGLPASATGEGEAIDGETMRAIDEEMERQNLENAVVGVGSQVLGRDGEKVGDVHEIAFDEETGRITRLVVRRGLIFADEREVPVSLIASVDDDFVYLSVDGGELAGDSS